MPFTFPLVPEGITSFEHFRHAGHAADEDDFVDVACRYTGIGQSLLAGINRSLYQGLRAERVHQVADAGPDEQVDDPIGEEVLHRTMRAGIDV